MTVERLMIAVGWAGLGLGAFRAHLVFGILAAFVAIIATIRARSVLASRPLGRPPTWADSEIAVVATSAAVVVLIAGSVLIGFASPIYLSALAWTAETAWFAWRPGGHAVERPCLLALALGVLAAGALMAATCQVLLQRRFWPRSTDRKATLRVGSLVVAAWLLVGAEAIGLHSAIDWLEGRKQLAGQVGVVEKCRDILERRRWCLAHVDSPERCDECRSWPESLVRSEVKRCESAVELQAVNARDWTNLFLESPIHRWRYGWGASILLPPLLAVPLALSLRRGLAATALGGPDP